MHADGDVLVYLRGNHNPGPETSRIGVNEGGGKPQKGTAFSREKSHYLGGARLRSASGRVTQQWEIRTGKHTGGDAAKAGSSPK